MKRESRRSEPFSVYGGHGVCPAGRSAAITQPFVHAGSENTVPSTTCGDKMERRMGRQVGLRGSSGAYAGPSPRSQGHVSVVGGALGDITNVMHASGRGASDGGKAAKGCLPQQPQPQPQPPQPQPQQLIAPASRSPPPLPPPPPPASTAAGLSARGSAVFDAAFAGDVHDPQKISEYAADIHAQLFHDEALSLPTVDYMERQIDINTKMRAILIDWLVEVHMKYRLRPETLFLAVNLIDRYLSVRTVMRKKLQLLGVVCMWIAAKFEEINPPKLREFVYITDNTYTKNDILSMECIVLVALNFEITAPTPAHFMDRLLRANGGDLVHRCLTEYLLELGLLDLQLMRHPPSLLVSAAVLLSNELLGQHSSWPSAMEHHARRSASTASACAEEFRALLEAAPRASLQAVQRKFQLEHHCGIASMNFNLRPRE